MKLYDKTAKQLIDVNPNDVPAALATGKFSFEKNQKVPINYEGKLMFTTPEYAGRYRDRLTFANEADVEQASAERATAGIGGAVEATALGLGKALTLGAGPALLGAVSDTARERMRELELGRPNITAAAEFGGLLVDPFALAGRVGQRAALRGAEQLAAREAEQVAARAAVSPEIGAGQAAALFGPARQTPAGVAAQVAGEAAQVGRGAIGREVSPAIDTAQAAAASATAAPPTATASMATQAAAPAAPKTVAQQFATGFQIMANGVKVGSIEKIAADLEAGRQVIFRNPGAVQLAMNDPYYAGKLMPDGSFMVTGVMHPVTGNITGVGAFQTAAPSLGGAASAASAASAAAAPASKVSPLVLGRQAAVPTAEEAARLTAEAEARRAAIGQSAVDRARGVATDEVEQMIEAESLRMRPLTGPTSPAEPGLRLGADPFRTEQLAMRGRQAEELMAQAQDLRQVEAAQMERVNDALQMRDLAAADAATAAATRAGRMAEEIEAANTIPQTLRTAETRVVSENVSPRLGIPAAPAPNVSPLGLGMAETGVMPAARGLALGAPIEARAAQAATDMTAAAAPGLIERIGRPALEGALYSGATQAYKQELGLEPGGAGEVLAATALGGVIGKGLSLGGKALVKGQKALTDAAAETAPESLAGMIGKAASGIERTHLLRQWGQTQKAVRKLNERFTEDELGKLGSTAMTDYIRNAAARIEELKAAHPENQFLQSINVGTKGLTFTNLSAEQRNAMAQVLREQAGKEVEAMYGPALNQVIGEDDILAAIARAERKVSRPGLGDIPLRSIREEAESLRNAIQKGEQFTVRSLRDFEIGASREFERKQGLHEPFTEAQSAFRTEIKNLYLDAAEQAVPGLRKSLVGPNKAYTLADMLAKGSQEVMAKAELTSPVGRDSLAQFALGAFAMVQPVAAAAFFLGTTALRGLYNQRGEGFIADMAGKLSRKASNVVASPEAAAREVTQSILNAQRPLLGAFNAEKLIEVKPADYTSLSRGIRELAASTDFAHEKIRQATANLPPDQQERFIADYDATMQKLVDEMPKGIPTDKALSEAERRWTVMARSLFDHAYATQTIANGGPMATAAAQGLTMIPNGQKYLDELATNLQRAIAENEKLRGNQQLATIARNFSKAKTGGGGIRIQRTVHAGSQVFQPPAGGRLPTPGASGQAAARNSLGGVYATPR